jgi:hypothetical protein
MTARTARRPPFGRFVDTAAGRGPRKTGEGLNDKPGRQALENESAPYEVLPGLGLPRADLPGLPGRRGGAASGQCRPNCQWASPSRSCGRHRATCRSSGERARRPSWSRWYTSAVERDRLFLAAVDSYEIRYPTGLLTAVTRQRDPPAAPRCLAGSQAVARSTGAAATRIGLGHHPEIRRTERPNRGGWLAAASARASRATRRASWSGTGVRAPSVDADWTICAAVRASVRQPA